MYPETKVSLPSTQHEVSTLAAWMQKTKDFGALLPDEILARDGEHGSCFPAAALRAVEDKHSPRGQGQVITQLSPGGPWSALSF